jgi:hypothetical protein
MAKTHLLGNDDRNDDRNDGSSKSSKRTRWRRYNMLYNGAMNKAPQDGRLLDISQSALKDGFTTADAQRVFDTYIHNSPIKDRDGVEVMLG